MNLAEFLSFKTNCPICNSPLKLSFHSKKWQNIKYENDRLNVTFRMDGIKKGQKDYKVIYSFGLTDNTWYIDLALSDKVEDHLYYSLLTRFKDLDKNLRQYCFYKSCDCARYRYSSNHFMLKYDGTLMDELSINLEYIGLSSKLKDGYRVVKIYNKISENNSTFSYSKEDSDVWARSDSNISDMDFLKVPRTIPFTSQEEVIEKVSKYFLFS